MLKLIDIKKDYGERDFIVPALKGISLEFRKSEFVSILGPSGCGKTTLLNIIGGLDKYSSGDLIINGRSTIKYNDKDWDAYRNRTIGFVFQDYNLIPHLNITENVELALTLSGVKAKERKERALKALDMVGLSAHAKKKPNQLSGGQKQRVAIARAIINNPDVILADEPTGALDSKTSIQIMEILKEISKERLVIMVTHNNELAEKYSTRIISLLDGKVTSDTNPYNFKDDEKVNDKLEKARTSMSIFTSLGISMKNLLTKKARTILTAIASSIGIVGIALILSVSNGFNIYIDSMQRDTLATLPITISPTAFKADYSQISEEIKNELQNNANQDGDAIISYTPSTSSLFHNNKITKEYIEYIKATDKTLYNFISYQYNMDLNIATKNENEYRYLSNIKIFQMADNTDYLKNEYPLINNGGHYPTKSNEILLVLNSDGQINENVLQLLNLGKGTASVYQPTDFLGKTFKLVLNNQYYTQTQTSPVKFEKNNLDSELYDNAENITLTIVGIVKNNSASSKYSMSSLMGSSSSNEGLGLGSDLIELVHQRNFESSISVAQRTTPMQNVLTGTAFTPIATSSAEQVALEALQNLGGYELPTTINIYTTSFDTKVELKAYLDAYNTDKEEENKILYTDASELLSDTFSGMLDAVSIVLIIFAAISLVVSSIMIGIITYVSVIERTKEIGVLRSLGARKRDISSVFNAETFLVGLVAGVIGIILTLLFLIPINAIISTMAQGVNVSAVLNPLHALILIVLSTLLTLISGLIPARIASKKEPVLCLRAE